MDLVPVPRLTWWRLLFSYGGRIDRRTYALWGQIAQLVLALLGLGGAALICADRAGIPDLAAALYAGFFLIVVLWAATAILAKRINDIGWPGTAIAATLLVLDFALFLFQQKFPPADPNRYLLMAGQGLCFGIWICTALGLSDAPNDHGTRPMRFAHVGSIRRYAPGWGAFLIDLVLVLALPLVPMLLLRGLVIEPFGTPSASMAPTLVEGEYYLVSKYAYGGARLPARGEVVVFRLPSNPDTLYVRRVIGLPGDQVQMVDGRLMLNGAAVPRTEIEGFDSDDNGRLVRLHQYRETLPEGASYGILQEGEAGPLDNTPTFTVPEGNIFLLGDNRSNSLDSRLASRVGYVPVGNLVGRAGWRYFSFDFTALTLRDWAHVIRWPRLLTPVE